MCILVCNTFTLTDRYPNLNIYKGIPGNMPLSVSLFTQKVRRPYLGPGVHWESCRVQVEHVICHCFSFAESETASNIKSYQRSKLRKVFINLFLRFRQSCSPFQYPWSSSSPSASSPPPAPPSSPPPPLPRLPPPPPPPRPPMTVSFYCYPWATVLPHYQGVYVRHSI